MDISKLNIYEANQNNKGFNKALFSYIFGIMSDNHLEPMDFDYEMFRIIFTTNFSSINGIFTSDIMFYYEEDIRAIYFAYFKLKTIVNAGDKTIYKLCILMRNKIIDYDLSPTDADFENCLELIKKEYPKINGIDTDDLFRYKIHYFKESYYNLIRIIHSMKGSSL